jgi:hypothetical protein
VTELADRPAWSGFRVELDYNDRDLAAYDRIAAARLGRSSGLRRGLGMMATGFIAALIGTGLAVASRVVYRSDGGLIAAFIFGGFWLGVWSPTLWSRRQARRTLAARQAASRQRWHGAILVVSPRGIVLRLSGVRGFYRLSAIEAATEEQGMVLLWTAAGSAILVPARQLEPA